MADQTLTLIRGLAPQCAVRAWWLVAITRVAGYPTVITSGSRTQEEQRKHVQSGASLTINSAHTTGEAFDIDMLGWHPDDVPTWVWQEIGPWAERELGLVWGGRWSSLRDYRHFELPRSLRGKTA